MIKSLVGSLGIFWVLYLALASTLVLGVLLLCMPQLEPQTTRQLVASTLVYAMGAWLWGFLYLDLGMRGAVRWKRERKDTDPELPPPTRRWLFGVVVGLHVSWLFAFVAYLVWRVVL